MVQEFSPESQRDLLNEESSQPTKLPVSGGGSASHGKRAAHVRHRGPHRPLSQMPKMLLKTMAKKVLRGSNYSIRPV